MATVELDGAAIDSWEASMLHQVAFGFPEFYANTIDAWPTP
jgi:hypothetical protein